MLASVFARVYMCVSKALTFPPPQPHESVCCAEVALGNEYHTTAPMWDLKRPPRGYNSVVGMPSTNSSSSHSHGGKQGFRDKELVVYSLQQQRVRFVLQLCPAHMPAAYGFDVLERRLRGVTGAGAAVEAEDERKRRRVREQMERQKREQELKLQHDINQQRFVCVNACVCVCVFCLEE